MVRTRGDCSSSSGSSSAGRKAVVARAPRKALGSSSSVSCFSSSSKVSSKKGKPNVGHNSLKMWPTPAWQKELRTFIGVQSPSREEHSKEKNGESSSSSSSCEQVMEEPQGMSETSTPESSPKELYDSSEDD